MMDGFYRNPYSGECGDSITLLEIRKVLHTEYPEIAMSNLTSGNIGRALKELKVKKTRSSKGIAYSLAKRVV